MSQCLMTINSIFSQLAVGLSCARLDLRLCIGLRSTPQIFMIPRTMAPCGRVLGAGDRKYKRVS